MASFGDPAQLITTGGSLAAVSVAGTTPGAVGSAAVVSVAAAEAAGSLGAPIPGHATPPGPPSIAHVLQARMRIKDYVHLTPVLTSTTMDYLAGRQLYFKCENLQRGGSFKIRGAMNAIKCLPDSVTTVVTHSSGNHAQAIALACQATGRDAQIVMPDNAPAVKRAAVEGYGATITRCVSTQEARQATADAVLKAHGDKAHLVPPYDDVNVLCGQGTVGLEMLEQIKDLDAVVVPVGGGGLLSGICLAIKGTRPDVRIFAAEPAAADDCARSMAKGERVMLEAYPKTVADGLRTSLGEHNWPIIRDSVEKVFTVSEDEIVAAQRLIWERMKLVIEPSAGVPAAVAIGAQLKDYLDANGPEVRKIGVVLCGGNQDLDDIPWVKK